MPVEPQDVTPEARQTGQARHKERPRDTVINNTCPTLVQGLVPSARPEIPDPPLASHRVLRRGQRGTGLPQREKDVGHPPATAGVARLPHLIGVLVPARQARPVPLPPGQGQPQLGMTAILVVAGPADARVVVRRLLARRQVAAPRAKVAAATLPLVETARLGLVRVAPRPGPTDTVAAGGVT